MVLAVAAVTSGCRRSGDCPVEPTSGRHRSDHVGARRSDPRPRVHALGRLGHRDRRLARLRDARQATTGIGRLRPALAKAFSTPNPTTYVYNRPQEGQVLGRHDADAGGRRLLAPAGREQEGRLADRGVLLGASSRSRRPGDRVDDQLKQPDPYFRYSLAVTYIVEKEYWSGEPKDIGTPEKLTMGTGPYRFTKFQGDGTTSSSSRNDGYWGAGRRCGRAAEGDHHRGDAAARGASGQVDGTFNIPQEQIDQWKRLSDTKIQLAPELRTAYVSLDTAIRRSTTSTCAGRSRTRSTRPGS